MKELPRIYKFARLLWFCLLICLIKTAPTQPVHESWQETGLPYIQNFSPKDYRAHPQNWCVAEGPNGIVYVGNTFGLLSFDGVSWRLYETPKKTVVRSIAIIDERIYAGSQNELGYFAPDNSEGLKYFSLIDSLSAKDRVFSNVWHTMVLGNAVYFQSHDYVFYWINEQMNVWYPTDRFNSAFVVNNTFFAQQRGVGLTQQFNDSLKIVPGGEQFARERIYVMLPFEEDKLLIGTLTQGLFLYDGFEFTRFPTRADDFFLKNDIYHGVKLSNDLYAFAARREGAVIIDKAGNLCQPLNRTSGLRNDKVLFMYPDRQGGIWLALNNGLARVETPAPYSRYKAESGITSMIIVLGRHHGKIYAGTQTGVKYFDVDQRVFKAVQNSTSQVWRLLSVGNTLLAATNTGILRVLDDDAQLINTGLKNVKCLYQSRFDSSVVFASHPGGLAVLKSINNNLANLGQVEGVVFRATEMLEARDSVLWLGTPYEGVYKVEFNSTAFSQNVKIDAKVTHFTQEHGLRGRWISPVNIDGRTLFTTEKGLKRFDDVFNRFVADSTLGTAFADTACQIHALRQGPGGHVWAIAKLHDEIVMHGKLARQADGNYEWQGWPLLRINDIGEYFDIYSDQDGTVWIGGSEGIGRYDAAVPKDYTIDFPALVRRVSGISSDTVHFYGNGQPESFQADIDYENNSLRIEFAALSYDDVSANQYQFKLQGFDKDWSKWTSETRKDYTGLPPGDYQFRVRAKNIYGHQSREGIFAFSILPPWYRTWWAYFFYALTAGGLVVLLVKLRVRQLQLKTKQLEALVAERTGTIREQAEKLKEMDRLKSRFFANISHEFRTPLTLILGPLEDMLAKANKEDEKTELSLMRRNARRLLRLINQLLDLSRLESGRLTLRASRGDFLSLLKGIVMSFASLAEQKNIRLQFQTELTPQDLTDMYFDRDTIEKIFVNLISNAFKFTPDGGRVIVSINLPLNPLPGGETGVGKSDAYTPQYIEIYVSDTGPGIPAEHLPHIFERFYQVDRSNHRSYEGMGIGLALTRELVELHHGTIEAKSQPGAGTEFVVRLPPGKAHFAEDEVIEELHPAETVEVPALPETGAAETLTEEPLTALPPGSKEADEDATIILVVDDHPDVRRYIRRQLQSDFTVTEARDGKQGLNAAAEIIPDLVISDVMMPEMDGYQLCRALKTNEKTSHIPVILLTAKAWEQDKLTGLETGADDYLIKPFNSKELQIRVTNLIESRQKLRERFRREGILQPREIVTPSAQEAFLQKLMQILEEHLEEEDFGVEALSEALNLGRRQLHRKIRSLNGQSPTEFIRSVRLQRARQMLEQQTGTVSEIAYAVGFNNLSYFAKSFRQEFGKAPSEYLKKNESDR